MTGHQINSLVGDLVAMAQAMEKLPQVERQVTELEHELEARSRANADLRESNDILREHIDTLETKISEVTRERDDASFRVLETEDKLAAWERLAKAFSVDVSALVKAQTPEPVELPNPYEGQSGHPLPTATTGSAAAENTIGTNGFEGQRVADPTGQSHTGIAATAEAPTVDQSSVVSSGTGPDPYPRNERGQFAGLGQGEPLPTATSSHDESAKPVGDVGAGSMDSAGGSSKPFAGKLYINVPGWLSRQQWLDGGGTDATYDWRQGQPLPDGIAA